MAMILLSYFSLPNILYMKFKLIQCFPCFLINSVTFVGDATKSHPDASWPILFKMKRIILANAVENTNIFCYPSSVKSFGVITKNIQTNWAFDILLEKAFQFLWCKSHLKNK